MQARLHFAIPYYSNLDYLREAIASVRAQTLESWRLIVVDDSGRGEAEALVRGFEDARIDYHRNPVNVGIGANWNRCLELAHSEFVNVIHADDRLRPHFAASMLAALDRHPSAAAAFCRADNIDAQGRPARSFLDWYKTSLIPSSAPEFVLCGEPALVGLIKGDFVICPSLVLRMAALGPMRFDPQWRQVLDLDFLSRLLTSGQSLVGLNAVGLDYRRHDGSQTSVLTKSLRRFEEEIEVFEHMAIASEGLGWSRAARRARGRTVIKLHLLFQIGLALAGGRLASVKAYLELFRRTLSDSPRLAGHGTKFVVSENASDRERKRK